METPASSKPGPRHCPTRRLSGGLPDVFAPAIGGALLSAPFGASFAPLIWRESRANAATVQNA
jgi:hypothetical protein